MGPGFEPQGGHHRECELECENANPSNSNSHSHCFSPGAEIGRQAWLRAMCPYGREGSSPSLGTIKSSFCESGKSFFNKQTSIYAGPLLIADCAPLFYCFSSHIRK